MKRFPLILAISFAAITCYGLAIPSKFRKGIVTDHTIVTLTKSKGETSEQRFVIYNNTAREINLSCYSHCGCTQLYFDTKKVAPFSSATCILVLDNETTNWGRMSKVPLLINQKQDLLEIQFSPIR